VTYGTFTVEQILIVCLIVSKGVLLNVHGVPQRDFLFDNYYFAEQAIKVQGFSDVS